MAKKTAQEILDVIKNELSNQERMALLDMMYDEYYNKGEVPTLERDKTLRS